MKTEFTVAEIKRLAELSQNIEAQKDEIRAALARFQEQLEPLWDKAHRAEVAAIEYLTAVIEEEEVVATDDDDLADEHAEFIERLKDAVNALSEADVNFNLEAEFDEALTDAGVEQTLCDLLDIPEKQ